MTAKKPKLEKIVSFTYERDTQNMVRWKEEVKKGETPIIRVLYLSKKMFPDKLPGEGDRIQITISELLEHLA